MRIAFVGGTGPAGLGLGARRARAGHEIGIGSRSPDRAKDVAERIRGLVPDAHATAGTNLEVLDGAEVVFLTVRDDAQRETVRSIADHLAGKIVVSIANPLRVESMTATYVQPPEGSLAEEAQRDAPDAHVVSAFHEIRVSRLARLDRDIESDTLVCGDDDSTKKVVMALAADAGVRAVDAGPLVNSRYVEAFVAVLISINFRYKVAASLRITGLPD